jgi:hypothetical protein
MRSIAERFFRSGPPWFERVVIDPDGVPQLRASQPMKHYTKALAKMIIYEQDYLLWSGHDPDRADGVTTTVINTAIGMLMAERWSGTPEHGDALDAARLALEEVLARSPRGDTWDEERQIYLVNFHRNALLADARHRHPFLADYLTAAADQLRARREQLRRDGAKLAREITEGRLPLHERLRKMVAE